MNIKELESYLEAFMCAESDFPFGPDALVFKVKRQDVRDNRGAWWSRIRQC